MERLLKMEKAEKVEGLGRKMLSIAQMWRKDPEREVGWWWWRRAWHLWHYERAEEGEEKREHQKEKPHLPLRCKTEH